MKYRVKLIETVFYYVDLEARHGDEARYLASEMWAESKDPTNDYRGEGQGVEVVETWLDPPNWSAKSEEEKLRDLPTRARCAGVRDLENWTEGMMHRWGVDASAPFGAGEKMNLMRRAIIETIDKTGDWVSFCTERGVAISEVPA